MEKMRNPPGPSNCVRYREVSAIDWYDSIIFLFYFL